ncbi:MAG: GGDEF domain-containing protein [Candidatus Zixiibacteriota bacterium]|nr:MAG: GGDEF domain-containing protein [candidate division Zixibacteria bacterium]
MIEKILIVILCILVVVLSTLLWLRYRKTRNVVILDRIAVNELLAAFVNNLRRGKIQDIAGRVSHVLRKHLGCDRIVFLRSFKGNLELNYVSGVKRLGRKDFRVRISQDIQARLKAYHHISAISELSSLFSGEYLKRLRGLRLKYFFPVFVKDQLYGLYFVATDLPLDNSPLRFLTTALAFNLSTAYYMGSQEQQLRNYESRVKSLETTKSKAAAKAVSTGGGELARLLKIRNSARLTTELVEMLRKDCEFSKMIFCVRPDNPDETLISVNWHIVEGIDKKCRESFDELMSKTESGKICIVKDLGNFGGPVDDCIKQLRDGNIKYLTTLPWGSDRKAFLAWSGRMMVGDVSARLSNFRNEILPLIENAQRLERTEAMSYTDGLTGVYNFRFFEKRIEEEFDRARRYGRPMALLIIDIDDLKIVNDKYGHLAGDCILKSLARTLSASVRTNDVISRYGGDEFCLIMPETSREQARVFMERIRDTISSMPCRMEGAVEKHSYSVSIGGAVYPVDADSIDSLIHAADMALLKAKSEGRNCAKLAEAQLSQKM